MEIIGDDKKIRALFSEAKLADAQATPGFTSQWNRAQSRAVRRPGRAFKLSFAAVTALLVCALISLAVWSQYSQPRPTYSAFASVPALTSFAPAVVKTPDETTSVQTATVHRPSRSRLPRSTAQTDALTIASAREAAKEATNIDNWQSPTATLLSSQTDGLFKSLPQLNENANELKSFLPGHANQKEK